jgi:uncharacterized protein (UPF0335 family)
MANKKTAKIASPGAKQKPVKPAKPKKGPTQKEALAGAIEGAAEKAATQDIAALAARLAPVDRTKLEKGLVRYKAKMAEFRRANDEAKSIKSEATNIKKEIMDQGWEGKAISLVFQMADLDPEQLQRVLAQFGIMARTKTMDLPLGASGDLFDPTKGGIGGADPNVAAPSTTGPAAAAKSAAPQSLTTQLADIFELGRMDGKAGKDCRIPPGIADDIKKVQTFKDGHSRGASEALAGGIKAPKPTGNVTPIGAAKKSGGSLDIGSFG